MMRRLSNRRFAPALDPLDPRLCLSSGVSATLAHAVLSVQGSSSSAPIAVDVVVNGPGPASGHSVIVEGVSQFSASQVRKIQIVGMVGESIAVNAPPRSPIAVRVSRVGGATVPAPAAPATPTFPASSVPSVPGTMSALEQAVVDLTNQARQQNGLAPLLVNAALVRSAEIQSANMAQLNVLSHTLTGVAQPTLQSRAAAVGYAYSWLGENIAFNYPDAASLVAAWMNSPEHRANMLNPNFTDVGVSVAWNKLGQAYATEDFGSPR
jgi:uncharacterized protein YkwD